MQTKEAQEVAKAIFNIIPFSSRMIKKIVKDSGVTIGYNQLKLLKLIAEGEVIGATIAQKMCVSAPSVSNCIDRLVAHNYVERKTTENDRRSFQLVITKKGTEILENTQKQAVHSIAKKLTTVSQVDAKKIMSALDVLEKVFTEDK